VTVSGGLLRLQTPGNGEIVDITDGVARVVGVSGADRGLVTAFAVGSTAAVTTMEYEPGRRQRPAGALGPTGPRRRWRTIAPTATPIRTPISGRR
jgi:thiamine phosphate synthase YjbQ (UPF0047 family)